MFFSGPDSNPEPEGIVPLFRVAPGPTGGPDKPFMAIPSAAAGDFIRALGRSAWIPAGRAVVIITIIRIPNPFPNITGHIH